MDFELMINSFPKLLNAAVITLKLFISFFNCRIIHWSFICNFKIK